MAHVILNLGFANGAPGPAYGQYLKAYDPEGRNGRGMVTWTPDKKQAMQFAGPGEAFETWTAVPACRPLRSDGKPNKPLTAFTITIEPA